MHIDFYLNDHDLSKVQELEHQLWKSYLHAVVTTTVQVKMLANSPPINHLKKHNCVIVAY